MSKRAMASIAKSFEKIKVALIKYFRVVICFKTKRKSFGTDSILSKSISSDQQVKEWMESITKSPELMLALPKIVETDASDLGYGGILKQKDHDKEQIVQYVSAHWNECQKNYSTIKKEIISIVLCISKFQSDLLNQKFLLRIDCKVAKHVLEKDVQNIASK